MPWDTARQIVNDYIEHGYPGYGLIALGMIVMGILVGANRVAATGSRLKRAWDSRKGRHNVEHR